MMVAEEARTLQLSTGGIVLVDASDYDFLSRWRWRAMPGTNNRFYARRDVWSNGTAKAILMHRVLMGVHGISRPMVDHINGNGLDNRRSNLRLATQAQNTANTAPYRNNKSGFKGAIWNKKDKRFRAQITVDGKTVYLGNYQTAADAHAAYRIAAVAHFGEFARFESFPELGKL